MTGALHRREPGLDSGRCTRTKALRALLAGGHRAVSDDPRPRGRWFGRGGNVPAALGVSASGEARRKEGG